jgi:hypothetical protein
MHRYWFKAKRHGIGAIPATWEGWALAALAIVAILVERQAIPPHLTDPQAGDAAALLAQAATAAAALLLCRLKTEGGWRWRWGERR